MGIRIEKSIGYFLSKKDCDTFLNQNYIDVLYDFLYHSDKIDYNILINRMWDNFIIAQKNAKSISEIAFYDSAEMLLPMKLQEKQDISELFTTTCFGDEFMGLLIYPPFNDQTSRRDDAIDYYESGGVVKFKQQKLHRGIYPYDGHMLVKQDAVTNKCKLNLYFSSYFYNDTLKIVKHVEATKEKNKRLDWDKLSTLSSDKYVKKVVDTQYFKPMIPAFVLLLLDSLDLIKDQYSIFDVISHLEPSIITTWN